MLLGHSNILTAQTTISGIVTDAKTLEPIANVLVTVGSASTVTNLLGKYHIITNNTDSFIVSFTLAGYVTNKQQFSVSQTNINITLTQDNNQLNEVVVTSNRNTENIKSQTVSVDLIKPYIIENKITTNLEHIMNQLPSVNVVDGQVNIRSGSGWTYGAGSRVLVLVDDVPMITGDGGQVQWKFLPTENIASLEVVKGASSVLFGSGALNGVINIKTRKPTAKPQLQVNVFNGFYSKPTRDSAQWYNGVQWYNGANAFYSKRFNNTGITTGFNFLNDNGYRLGEYDKRFRAYAKINHVLKSKPQVQFGLNATLMKQQSASFLLWESYTYGYTSLDSIATKTMATVFSIDPHFSWQQSNYKLQYGGRFYGIDNNIKPTTTGVDQSNSSINFYNEFTALFTLKKPVNNITIGTSNNHTISNSPLYGNQTHTAANSSVFIQANFVFSRLTTNTGIRYEHFRINSENDKQLIARLGLSYLIKKHIAVRGSIGQGYRYPTIAERYIETSVGLLNIFPNPELKPEKGYSAELGIKQGLKLGAATGFIDVAWFYTEYDNMVEFNFGQWRRRTFTTPPSSGIDLRNIGFTSFNIGKAKISGIDVGFTNNIAAKNWSLLVIGGYTYAMPIMLEPTKVFAHDSSSKQNGYTYNYTSSDTSNNLLKYRYQHLAKLDLQFMLKNKYQIGFSLKYNSYMQNIDRVFITLPLTFAAPGVERGRNLNLNGDFIIDARLAYVYRKFTITATVSNILNTEIMSRPADLRPTRLVIIQLGYKL